MSALTHRDKRKLQAALARWFARNKRALPWRGTRDPYRIWLSEVMLQQTRVAAVLEYYKRFTKRFPTVKALAGASSEEVLRQWAGLGYYSRARNLHAAARCVVDQHAGRFPQTLEELRDLPGIGEYTAAAIGSIAYDLPAAVLDGNVARVLARIFAVRGELRAPRKWKRLQTLAQALLPERTRRPGDWNQAMMEFGATVCTPRAPRCDACPIAFACRARQLGIVERLPHVRRKRAAEEIALAVWVFRDRRGRVLLVREPNPYFSKMWHFPFAPFAPRERITAEAFPARYGVSSVAAAAPVALSRVRHTVTFRNLALHPFLVRVTTLPRSGATRSIAPAKIASLPVSSATQKVARVVLEHTSAAHLQ